MSIDNLQKPKVSILMTVYNDEEYVEQSLSSISNQSYKDYELILINDGSTDKSLEIMQSFAEKDLRIKLINQRNKGLIDSLNAAIAMSKGEFLARMDSDDISLPSRLEKQFDYMRKNDLDICGCHYFIKNKNDKFLDTVFVPLNKNSMLLYLFQGVPFAHGSVMIKSSFLKNNNLFYGEGKIYAEDKCL